MWARRESQVPEPWTKTLFKGTGTGAKGLMNGFPPQTAPRKQNKLIVNPTQTQISVGFETLPLLDRDFGGSRAFSASLSHTKYFREIGNKQKNPLLLNFSSFLNTASIGEKIQENGCRFKNGEKAVYRAGSSPWLQ